MHDEQTQTSLLALLPEPWKLKDIDKGAHRIVDAILEGEKIVIFGDYDVDGTTSCALLHEFFLQLGVQVEIYIPDRLTEGYGLNVIGIEKLIELMKL